MSMSSTQDRPSPSLRRLGCTPAPQEARDVVQAALKRLSALRYRQTPLLHAVLTEMAEHHVPVTINHLMALPSISDSDYSSTYRLLKRLESEGIVTCLGVAQKAPHYLLVMPGHQHAYLVCKVCGVLEETDASYSSPTVCGDCEFTPWSHVQSEVWFTGICPECA